VRPHQGKWVKASKANIAAARKFYETLELDGASDLGATLQHAAHYTGVKGAQVVYIGDGTPTWGATSETSLQQSAKLLQDAPLFAAVLGRGASTDLWKSLSGGKEGTVVRPKTALQARQAALFLANAQSAARVANLQISAAKGVSVFPSTPVTLFAGERLFAIARAPAGKNVEKLEASGELAGKPFRQRWSLGQARPASRINQRWASREIHRLQAEGADKEEIVELSQKFGVLSKHTSLLVLESEEAYKEHQIERRQAEIARANTPQVSGGDLDNLNGQSASLSPDNIQPGDPEVRIPAPRDARSVVLVFPFGDTKLAHYDEDAQTWIARFLIDQDTPDGRYWVRATIEHRDGSIEELSLPYTVDTSPPNVKVRAYLQKNGRLRIVVKQVLQGQGSADAKRVDVQLPWGRSETLIMKREGFFRRAVKLAIPIGDSIELRVVVTDAALNQRVETITVPVVREGR
jgi:hypothetical protein